VSACARELFNFIFKCLNYYYFFNLFFNLFLKATLDTFPGAIALLGSAVLVLGLVINTIFYLNRKIMTSDQSTEDIDEALKTSGHFGMDNNSNLIINLHILIYF
jgi:hypothetical protein